MRISDIENELLPMLRETAAPKMKARAQKQLAQWAGTPGVRCEFYSADTPRAARLPGYNTLEIHYDCEKMFVSQLKMALGVALSDSDGVPSVRGGEDVLNATGSTRPRPRRHATSPSHAGRWR